MHACQENDAKGIFSMYNQRGLGLEAELRIRVDLPQATRAYIHNECYVKKNNAHI